MSVLDGICDSEEWKTTLAAYHALVLKKFAEGLTEEEAEEKERLGKRLEEMEHPYYEPIIENLRKIAKAYGYKEPDNA